VIQWWFHVKTFQNDWTSAKAATATELSQYRKRVGGSNLDFATDRRGRNLIAEMAVKSWLLHAVANFWYIERTILETSQGPKIVMDSAMSTFGCDTWLCKRYTIVEQFLYDREELTKLKWSSQATAPLIQICWWCMNHSRFQRWAVWG